MRNTNSKCKNGVIRKQNARKDEHEFGLERTRTMKTVYKKLETRIRISRKEEHEHELE